MGTTMSVGSINNPPHKMTDKLVGCPMQLTENGKFPFCLALALVGLSLVMMAMDLKVHITPGPFLARAVLLGGLHEL